MSSRDPRSDRVYPSESRVTLTSLDSAADGLKAASLLLARRAPLAPVHSLHVAAAQALSSAQEPGLPEKYQSQAEAEQQHRRLLRELGALRRRSWRRTGKSALRVLLPALVSWLIVISIGAGLALRYGAGVIARVRWQHQHPDGQWLSRYYWNRKFEGSPLVRYDVAVDYNWGRKAPADAMLRDRWSARWDTCLLVKRDLSLLLSMQSDDSAKLYVDEVLQFQNTKPAKKQRTVRLSAGLRHLRIDFQEAQGDAVLRLNGLNFSGTDAYEFRRPTLVNDEARCQDSTVASLTSPSRGDGSAP